MQGPAVLESRERCERIPSLTGPLVWSVAPDGSLEWANPASQWMLGVPPSELVGRPFLDAFHAEDRPAAREAMAGLGAGERSFEGRCRCADGSHRLVLWSLARDADRGRLYAVGQDASVRHGHDRPFRLALEACPASLLMVDSQGTIVVANGALERLFGYERNELVGQAIEVLVPEPLRAGHVASREGYLSDPEERAMGAARALAGVSKDGRLVPVELRLNPVRTPGGTFVLASVFEIGERQQLERERDRIFELTQDLVCVNGPDGVLKRVNPAVVQSLGFSVEELTRRPFLDFIHPDDRTAAEARFRHRLEGEEAGPSEVRCLCKDGSVRVVLWSATFDPERRVIYAVGHDITARKREEDELRRAKQSAEAVNRELEAFSYSVSHDLRSPLRAIDGFSLALLEDYGDVLDGAGKRHLDRVRRAAQRMSALIDDLLNLSRISRRELRPELLDLSRIADDVVEDLRQRDPKRRVEVEIARDLVARGDAGLLEVALRNLLDNAWKYTRKREDARIEVGRAFADGEPAYFVRDNGVGFDADHADRLFGAFQRLHRPEEFEGTGIGLATVQRIVNLHGGRLWADAAVNEGAEFFFTLGAAGGA